MKAKLYSTRPPDQRCLLLAKALSDVSTLPGSDCIYMAKELYWSYYPQDNPVVLPLKVGADTSQLEQICAESGIVFELFQEEEVS